jgi:RNA polymerase sigma-70 factor (ECF subfamily)
VFRLAVSILGHEFVLESEDVAQDVMVRVYCALRSFRGDASFGSWMYRIAFNHALNVKARLRYRAPHLRRVFVTPRESLGSWPGFRRARPEKETTSRFRALRPRIFPADIDQQFVAH